MNNDDWNLAESHSNQMKYKSNPRTAFTVDSSERQIEQTNYSKQKNNFTTVKRQNGNVKRRNVLPDKKFLPDADPIQQMANNTNTPKRMMTIWRRWI